MGHFTIGVEYGRSTVGAETFGTEYGRIRVRSEQSTVGTEYGRSKSPVGAEYGRKMGHFTVVVDTVGDRITVGIRTAGIFGWDTDYVSSDSL